MSISARADERGDFDTPGHLSHSHTARAATGHLLAKTRRHGTGAGTDAEDELTLSPTAYSAVLASTTRARLAPVLPAGSGQIRHVDGPAWGQHYGYLAG